MKLPKTKRPEEYAVAIRPSLMSLVLPAGCPRGIAGALCRSRCGACRVACRSAQAAAIAACVGLTGPALAACSAAALVAGNECYNGCC